MLQHTVAIVGMACLYPDAHSPAELWENILAQRRSFRRFPRERLNLADYYSSDRSTPDRTYGQEASVIEGYQFDRVRFRVGGTPYRATDLTHWLALDIAEQAIADAGFTSQHLPRETTGVLLGNTLTGEFSRANIMRLRWPYVRRVAEAALLETSLSASERRFFIDRLGENFKAPFAPIGEDSLAGGLANTIAGRICNYFDLKGGGYTVDGACSSSLLAVASGCTSLINGDLDVVIAGGVDLSLDPFELVGFAKAGALSAEDMRIYDRRPAGFLPGEGCGMVVLMRLEEAIAQNKQIWATIRGWGISSDGHGGLTRPEVEGQLLALHRAYRHVDFGPEAISYFEGHGTGTPVGDACELQVLARARAAADPQTTPAAVGSIKAIIGHTKAAAGVAGLIKTALAVHHRILPPTTGCEAPHALLEGEDPALRVLKQGEAWPTLGPARAAVSSMGFGGINAHIVLESAPVRTRATHNSQHLLRSAQDAELVLIDGNHPNDLAERLLKLAARAESLSRAEVTDVAVYQAGQLANRPWRAAVVAASPSQLAEGLTQLAAWLNEGTHERLDIRTGLFLGHRDRAGRIGFLFPGQGASTHVGGGSWARRFEEVQALYTRLGVTDKKAGVQTAIVCSALAGLHLLEQLGIQGNIAVGHSLGELVALYWSGAIDETTLIELVAERSQAMSVAGSGGGMASLRLGQAAAESQIAGTSLVIAGLNSPQQTIVSGPKDEITALVERCFAQDILATPLKVSNAFHSPLVASSAEVFSQPLAQTRFAKPIRSIVSTLTGTLLNPETNLARHLADQIVAPVRFLEAISEVASRADLLLEVGPGHILTNLSAESVDTPCVTLDAGGPALKGLLLAAGASYVLGSPINTAALFADRFSRPFDLEYQPRFFVNPCELAPALPQDAPSITQDPLLAAAPIMVAETVEEPTTAVASIGQSTLSVVIALVAERAELPVEAIEPGHRLLSDLHLNSITVGQVVAEAARRLHLVPPTAPGDYADATVTALVEALDNLASSSGETQKPLLPSGIDAWIRPFAIQEVERPLESLDSVGTLGSWQLFAPDAHPLAAKLKDKLSCFSGQGVLVCLPEAGESPEVSLLLAGAQAAIRDSQATHFVLVHAGGGGSGLARTLCLESPRLTVVVLDVPFDAPGATDWIAAEIAAAKSYTEVRYDQAGRRYQSEYVPVALNNDQPLPLGHEDVLLVTGGGKGIASECALVLALASGARLALVGRSDPQQDTELATNLDRMRAAGLQLRYYQMDVTNAASVREVVDRISTELGQVTAFLHSAGTNVPRLISALDEAAFERTLAPKLTGLRNVLAAIDPSCLRLLITFGSIIARSGMPGNADYAVANEWLTLETERWRIAHPHCRTLAAEWSVWSGLGMGERLGKIGSLIEQGITPITPQIGVALLKQMLTTSNCPTAIVVSGRLHQIPTMKLAGKELPFWRFLESPQLHYPGIELVADSVLSLQSDPYVGDHVFGGEALLPAVFGLEAMLQAAMAVSSRFDLPTIEQVELLRPIIVPRSSQRTLRVAALVQAPGLVEVVLRSDETGFATDHFRATCHFRPSEAPSCPIEIGEQLSRTTLAVRPAVDMYGSLLFHSGRFCRLKGYRHLRATECFAEICEDASEQWFDRLLPGKLVWGDPGARDTALHGIQGCIPHATLLPIGVDRIVPIAGQPLPNDQALFFKARERSQVNQLFTYDLEIFSSDGCLLERWEGLRLQLIAGSEWQGAWPAPLLAPYIERRVQELNPGMLFRVAIEPGSEQEPRRERSDRALRQVSSEQVIWRRPDGRPEILGQKLTLSAAHTENLVMAVASQEVIGCDLEAVQVREEETWLDLLGQERFALAELIASLRGESADAARTRVWTALESLKKAGLPQTTPLTLLVSQPDGWIVLSAGKLLVATFVTHVKGHDKPLAFAVVGPNAASHRPQGAKVLPCLDRLSSTITGDLIYAND